MSEKELLEKLVAMGWFTGFEITASGFIRKRWTDEGAICAAAFRICWLCFPDGDICAADRFREWLQSDSLVEIGAVDLHEMRPFLLSQLHHLGESFCTETWYSFLEICVSDAPLTEGGV